MYFFESLRCRALEKDTLLCVGLDPDLGLEYSSKCIREKLISFSLKIIEKTLPFVLCFKPNIAFFERYGAAGLEALKTIIAQIPAEIPVILDAKRGDIGNTAQFYAEAIFSYFGVQAVTLNGYLGEESIKPFLKWTDKGLFILVRTSNPSAERIQLLSVQNKSGEKTEPLYMALAREAISWGPQVGLVVAGNDYEALKRLRIEFPQAWFLAPGIGAQGGVIEEALSAGQDAQGLGIIPVVVRHIAEDPEPEKKANEYREKIRLARQAKLYAISKGDNLGVPKDSTKDFIIRKLLSLNCFKTGDFLLKSGLHSPFYLDLRKLIADPLVLKSVAEAYLKILNKLDFERIAAIPVASLPVATIISLLALKPLIYPRLPLKTHGSGEIIDGLYKAGERVVLIDDLVTTGLSKKEAVEVLRQEGLIVEDLVVLVERGHKARQELKDLGLRLHSVMHIDEIINFSEKEKIIGEETIRKIKDFLSSN